MTFFSYDGGWRSPGQNVIKLQVEFLNSVAHTSRKAGDFELAFASMKFPDS